MKLQEIKTIKNKLRMTKKKNSRKNQKLNKKMKISNMINKIM